MAIADAAAEQNDGALEPQGAEDSGGAGRTLPLLPLRDVVIFPHVVIPLFVGRPMSIKALEAAMAARERRVMLVAQKVATKDDPRPSDLYEMGCEASILQMLKLPDGTVKALVEGAVRARIENVEVQDGLYMARVSEVSAQEQEASAQTQALQRAALEQFDHYIKLNKKIPPEIYANIASIDEPGRLADTMAAQLPLKLEDKQKALTTLQLDQRLELLLHLLEREIEIQQVERKIRGRVKRQVEKNQREYYLNEQVKAIQKELGEGDDGVDLEELEKKIKAAHMSKEALKKAQSEFKKLRLMSPMSAEATVVRNYLDALIGLPWAKKTKLKHDLKEAENILNQDHFGLEKVKERILEYLAVQQRVDKVKSPILCLVGPPGVGKTSLGQSIARATGREYVRMALGGVRDEAEIRGHRRTYIGSLPGKILQSLTKAGAKNPLFLLDEIDKLGVDFRGDPASALLEVLDPEQNHRFTDHYVDVDFDLSEVMFVATSNSVSSIPAPLLDRMEVIRLSGYSEEEKLSIARRYLLPKQRQNNGVKEGELKLDEAAILDIIRYYTRESGVRSLEREIAKICRKAVTAIQSGKGQAPVEVTCANLPEFLGVHKYDYGKKREQSAVGQVIGLAWTEAGGDLLTVEAAHMPGKGNILRTGSLGEVMKESVEAARTLIRSRAARLGIKDEAFEKQDLHVHVPDGATPKDGPSAGIAITTAMVSSLTNIPVHPDLAMTGEITLRGEVTAIGGLKEKLLAAHRGGIKRVLIPEDNVKDLQDVPDNVKNQVEIMPVKWIDRVIELALTRVPQALPEPVEAVQPQNGLAAIAQLAAVAPTPPAPQAPPEAVRH